MTTALDVLNQARRWIGTQETPLGSNHVRGITDWYGIGNGAWCAMFVSRAFFDAGLPQDATIPGKGFAYCPSGVNWYRKNGRWKTSNPKPGDVVFFKWPGSDRAEHVGIVESVNSDGSINTIEGNTNKAGSAEGLYCMRQRRKSYIMGYGTPAFDGTSAPKPPAIGEAPGWGFVNVDGEFGPQTVRALQASLNSTGANPPLSVDGGYGPATKRALQARLNHTNGPVAIDGNVGPQTIRALQAHVGAGVDGNWGSETTRRLQAALNGNRF